MLSAKVEEYDEKFMKEIANSQLKFDCLNGPMIINSDGRGAMATDEERNSKEYLVF